MCYNGECWPVSKNDLEHLEGTHFRLLRRIVHKQADEHTSWDRVLSSQIYQLRSVGHALRRDITDRSHNNVTADLKKPHLEWTCKTDKRRLYCDGHWLHRDINSLPGSQAVPKKYFCTFIPVLANWSVTVWLVQWLAHCTAKSRSWVQIQTRVKFMWKIPFQGRVQPTQTESLRGRSLEGKAAREWLAIVPLMPDLEMEDR